ncbi:hypothetical protein ACTFIU_010305 [Dictyostelium citrinum]
MKVIDISEDNSFLFFKIWRNYVLKKIIFKHLVMFNLFLFSVDLDSLHQQQYIQDNKQYIKSLLIKINDIEKNAKKDIIYEMGEKLNNLPNHIDSIILYQTNHNKNANHITYDLSNLKFPSSLKYFKVHYNFNLPLSNKNTPFFSNLTELDFNYYFNQKIGENILPNSLKKLKLSTFYNQPFDEYVLPDNLKIIVFGCSFNQPLNNLPQSIEEIKFYPNSTFKKEINSNQLPQSLKKLSLPRNYSISLINGILPNKLEKLKISNINVDNLNISYESLKHLKLKVYNKNGNLSSNQEISNLFQLDVSKVIPQSLTNLSMFFIIYNNSFHSEKLSSQFCSINLNTTTPNLLSYWIYYKSSSKLLLNKFERIKSLKVNLIENDYSLDYHSKSCLKHLINLNLSQFDYFSFTKPVKDFKVFTQLKCLRIGNYNSTINSNTLPPSLELLELGYRFKQSIHKKWLPASIKYIIVLNDQTPISINSLPNSLESIWITDNHYQLKDFKFFTPLIGKLKIDNSEIIKKVYNKIYKKKYEFNLYL